MRREWSKKSIQQGRSHFCARSVLVLREHGTMARTPLAAFFQRSHKVNPKCIVPSFNHLL